MVKITIKDKKKYIMIKGIQVLAVVDKEFISARVGNKVIQLTKEGKIVNSLPYSADLEEFLSHSNICMIPTYYVENKRDCSGCKYVYLCQCYLNKYSYKKEVETDVDSSGSSTEVPVLVPENPDQADSSSGTDPDDCQAG